MRKKITIIALLFVLVSHTLLSGIGAPLTTMAEQLQSNLFTDVNLTDEQGQVIQDRLTPGSSINVVYDWSVQGLQVNEGDTYSFQLPSEIQVKESKQGSFAANGQGDIATYEVSTTGQVTVKFKETLEGESDGSGKLTIKATFNQEVIGDQENISIPFTIGQQQKVIEVSFQSAQEHEDDQQQEVADEVDTESKEQAEIETDIEVNGEKEETNELENEGTKEQAEEEEQVQEQPSKEETESEQTEAEPVQKSEQATNGIIEENILTGVELIYYDEEYEELDKPTIDSLIYVKYTWALENSHGYKAGDRFIFTVPEELKIYNPINGANIMFNDEVIGYFYVTKDGIATVEFTEFIEYYSNINGTLEIWTELDEELIITDDREITITPIEGKESIVIPMAFELGGSTIDKKGEPDRSYNAETIEWTIDFNKNMEKLENAVLSDPVQSGQQLKADSIKLYNLDLQLNGEVILGDEVNNYTVGKTADGQDFTINFNDEIQSAYRLVYETEITDKDQSVFKNEATLLSNGESQGKAEANVTIGRGSPLEKSSTSYHPIDQLITWEIKYNYNEKEIAQADAFLTDYFNNSQDLVKDSIKVEKVTIDENGHESGSERVDPSMYKVNLKSKEGHNGFELQFEHKINSPYKITYQTKANERVFDEEDVIYNKVTAGEETKGSERKVGQQILFKSHGTPNYQNKTVDWEITFNHDEYLMENVVLTDTFTNEGLTLERDTIKITTRDKPLKEGTDYTVKKNDKNEFVIEFKGTILTAYTITYTTTFDYEQRQDKSKNYLENKAHLTWKDQDGVKKEKTATRKFTPDDYTQHNGFKNGSYNAVTKEITWNIGINYNLKELNKAVVEDFIKGNQKLQKDSIKVYKMELTGGVNGTKSEELAPGSDYSLSWIDGDHDGDSGFRIEFKETIKTPYMIEYKTSLADLNFVEAQYDNKANLYSDGQKETELNASVTIPNGGKYIVKSGTQNGKVIDWKVDINFSQAKVSNVTIVDTPSNNQSLLENSFRLYETNIAEDGTVTQGKELTLGTDYTIEFKEDPYSFELMFKDEINEPYILHYQSLILEQPGGTVNNDVTFSGEGIEETGNKSQESVEVKHTEGMGDGQGEVGYLTVTKTDATGEKVLEGAQFTLKDAESGVVIATETTNEDGVVTFGRLLYGKYDLIEDEAPEGYVVQEKEKEIIINQPYEKGNDAKVGNIVTVKNDKIVQAVQLTKKDAETADLLAGAKFELEKKDGDDYKLVANLTTDENGVIYKDDLEPGEYRFIEIIAPDGYQLGTKTIEFTIDKNQIKATEVTATNLKLGSVKLVKFDEDDEDKRLVEVEFTLFREDGKVVQQLLRTDENGEIVVSDLQPGNYVFVETKAPAYYQLADTRFMFTVEPGETEPVIVEAPNQLITGSIELTKVDQDNEERTLAGAVFKLVDERGNTIKEGLETNESGKLGVSDLKPGKYAFIETKAPEHYELDETPIEFTIEKSKTYDDVKLVTVEATNELTPAGSVELTKVDIDNAGAPLANAEFELQNSKGETIQERLPTDEDGKLFVDNLKPGKYQFVEIKSPEGYALDPTPIEFTVEVGQTEPATVTAENELAAGIVELVKVDRANKNRKLAGAVFELQDEEGNMLQENLETDKNGELTLSLKPGKYQLVETKAPSGYRLDDTPLPFEIVTSEAEPIQLVKENRRRPSGGGGGTPPPTEDPDPSDPGKPGAPDPTDPSDPGQSGAPDPTNPSDPGQSGDTGKPGDSGQLGESNKGSSTDKGGFQLPRTATDLFNYALAGVAIFLAGLLLSYIGRKREQ